VTPWQRVDMIGSGGRRRSPGFSLVELLVAASITVLAMGAVASLFGVLGRSVSQSQSGVELNARMRNAAWQLRQDLTGLTAMPLGRLRTEANAGYLEIVDAGTPTGDTLALTTGSLGKPFMGRLAGVDGFESATAEVAWFCEPMPQSQSSPPRFNLHRRQLLVSAAPGAGGFAGDIAVPTTDWRTFYRDNDLSCHRAGNQLVANSLGDLAKRPNRFLVAAGGSRALDDRRLGEDVILGDVVAFNVRLFTGSGYADGSFQTRSDEVPAPGPAGEPLSGVEIEIRCLDPATGKERQVTVVHSFGVR